MDVRQVSHQHCLLHLKSTTQIVIVCVLTVERRLLSLLFIVFRRAIIIRKVSTFRYSQSSQLMCAQNLGQEFQTTNIDFFIHKDVVDKYKCVLFTGRCLKRLWTGRNAIWSRLRDSSRRRNRPGTFTPRSTHHSLLWAETLCTPSQP